MSIEAPCYCRECKRNRGLLFWVRRDGVQDVRHLWHIRSHNLGQKTISERSGHHIILHDYVTPKFLAGAGRFGPSYGGELSQDLPRLPHLTPRSGKAGTTVFIKVFTRSEIIFGWGIREVLNQKLGLIVMEHKFLVKYYARAADACNLYLITEYAPYGSFSDLIAPNRHAHRVTERFIKPLLFQIVLALEFLHSNKIIHRGVSLKNCMIFERGRAKLRNFRFARLRAFKENIVAPAEYVSPEEYRGLIANQALDWWAFGVMAFRLLVDRFPFYPQDGPPDYRNIKPLVLKGEPEGLDRANLSNSAQDLLRRLLEKDAGKRLNSPPDYRPKDVSGFENADAVIEHDWFTKLNPEVIERDDYEMPGFDLKMPDFSINPAEPNVFSRNPPEDAASESDFVWF